jgi:hypothetical protein
MEVRSYRRVFDLERRIYRVDQVRLNPGGVPVRGIVYSLLAIASAFVCERLPLIGTFAAPVPWFLRDLILPVALGSLLTATRIDGRSFEKSMHAVLRSNLKSRHLSVRARSSQPAVSRWHPAPLLMLPDGSDHHLRRLRFAGPGAIHVVARHRCESQRRGMREWRRPRTRLVLLSSEAAGEGVSGRVIVLDRGACLRVH